MAVAAIEALSPVVEVITHLAAEKLSHIRHHSAFYSFMLGLNGAGSLEGHIPLDGAGGRIPMVKAYDNLGDFIGNLSPGTSLKVCGSGADHCHVEMQGIRKQPAYALLIGHSDAVCIASVAVTYPSADSYGWIGNWARLCNEAW